ncbi:guanine deaminase [Asticcacaulis sp. YBE204]|uniref:guanine deaminase n=1 Tax=Asticcacaulis sp. YBE204 TaxID=1282363 RepID=UPI0003C3E81F|nr:guanine deaminase [Asticcacaulis sp. YBE204]ESQ79066.1 chlorohydrolase [Asticcacaulis sp. YBE204]
MTITCSFKGTFFHAPVCGQIEVLRDVLIRCDDEGRIADIVHPDTPGYAEAVFEDRSAGRLEILPDGTYGLPGFCDLHIHAPQWPQLGKALDVPLEVWLQKHTFPLEARYSDLGFARRSYEGLVDDLLSNGTTTALYFATQHQDATRLLADICLEKGQRALIGKVAMDNPQECPNFYVESTDSALRGTADFIDYVRSLKTERIKPVVTPRFIASCTDAALEGLGDLAKRCGCHIQTHCSESDWEHNYVLERHGMEDTDSLDRFGLLTRHTVLAHANFISEANMDKISARGAGIAHCPLSNYYFSNAVFPLKRALEKGLRVGLGTDISGGPSASIFDNMRWAVASSRALHDGVDARLHWDNRGLRGSQIDWRTAFHIATKGGAEALDLPVGTFEKGRYFDAQLIDPQAKSGTIRLMDDLDSDEEVLQKIVYTASKANIAKVWVAAACVVG